MITLNRVSKAHGADQLFEDASLQIVPGRKMAVVGRNGSGKTTLLELVLGWQRPDSGEVTRQRELRIGHLPQDVELEVSGGTVLEVVLDGAAEVADLEARLEELTARIAAADDREEREQLLEVYGREQTRFEQLGGYSIEAVAQRVLAGLGFQPDDGARPVDELSGGWRVRVALARLLLTDPDLLVLDEPTNHLDLESIRWLEETLVAHPSAVLFVSHDRDFIDAVAERVVEVAHGTLTEYVGGFAEFVAEREGRIERLRAAAANQEREIAKTERFIERFRYKASKARQVQSRIKSLEKLDRIEVPEDDDPRHRFRFPEPRRAGRVVATLEEATVGFDGQPVISDADLVLERGWKVAVLGPNGAGKTTLLRLLVGDLEPDAGTVTLGHNVDVGYFAQHVVEELRPHRTVLEEYTSVLTEEHRRDNPRTLLGAFGFGAEAADRAVRSLSGGELTRLALARLMANSANLLVLDEPTNHLDIASRDLLEDALVAYPGTVVLVTHDRHVIRGVADHVVEVDHGQLRLHEGDYESYLDRNDATAAERLPASAPPRPDQDTKRREAERRNALYRATKDLRSEVEEVEEALVAAEAEVAELTRQLADPAVYEDDDRVKELVNQHGQAKDRAAELLEQWERVQLQLEAAERRVEADLE
ncbi:MAG: ABC-F family ATP-binding cassette domain-containing protein [Nitriliruptorales bacterium]|nr:ABC-F family ATP-binding cassette domain-containing protein [Nitriliruptorales bacterium]